MDPWGPDRVRRRRDRFEGEICAFGSASGYRVVVGRWPVSPFGPLADVMVEEPGGRRVLLAPTGESAAYIAATYAFDDVRVVPVEAVRRPDRLTVTAGALQADVVVGARDGVGRLLRLVPRRLAAATAWATLVDPVGAPGVRTRGSAGGGRREWYGAHDRHRLVAVTASLRAGASGRWPTSTPRCGSGSGRPPAGRRSWR